VSGLTEPSNLRSILSSRTSSAKEGASFVSKKKQASFRHKTCGIKYHGGQFIPLSRVPPSGFIAWGSTWAKPALTHHGNGYAALPIGARIHIF
jgi:hypothetical protein